MLPYSDEALGFRGPADKALGTALRVAGRDDVEALARLKTRLSLESEHVVFDVADWQELTDRCLADLEAAEAGLRGVFVTECGGMLTGFIDIHPVPDDETCVLASFDLAVRKSWRGQGLGTALIAAGEAWAGGVGYAHIAILVAVRNASAMALYRRLEYTVFPGPGPSKQAETPLPGQLVLTKRLAKEQGRRRPMTAIAGCT